MPSVTPKGDLISQIRRSQGFTQLELALRAGISERTVRNAERGQAIKHDFLKFIASGLGVSLPEVVHSVDHLQLRERRHGGPHWEHGRHDLGGRDARRLPGPHPDGPAPDWRHRHRHRRPRQRRADVGR